MQLGNNAYVSKRDTFIQSHAPSGTPEEVLLISLSRKRKKAVGKYFRLVAFVLLCSLVISVVNMFMASSSSNTYWRGIEETLLAHQALETSTVSSSPDSNARIAIISSFLLGSQSKMTSFRDFDHLINKACYAKMWGYDFIFNMTYGFDRVKDQEQGGAYWLDYGTWHRVPHIRDRIKDYDWILYADVDYIINDMKRPLESFFKEWQLYYKNPSIFIPKDFNDRLYTFSAFAVLVRNDAFGRSVLDHWMKFAKGLCEKGNFHNRTRRYNWQDSDQPGLWYALTAAHREFFPEKDSSTEKAVCSNSTGLIDTVYAFGPELNAYFKKIGAQQGSGGSDLTKVPNDQPIIWSLPNNESYGGLGLQLNWGRSKAKDLIDHSFAVHRKHVKDWHVRVQETLALCKNHHGCYANFTDGVGIQVGCNGMKYVVAS